MIEGRSTEKNGALLIRSVGEVAARSADARLGDDENLEAIRRSDRLRKPGVPRSAWVSWRLRWT